MSVCLLVCEQRETDAHTNTSDRKSSVHGYTCLIDGIRVVSEHSNGSAAHGWDESARLGLQNRPQFLK